MISALQQVRFGASWCKMVSKPPAKKRFTVTLDASDYDELASLAKRSSPPLTLQYVVNYAVKRLLEQARDPQQDLDLGDPLGARR